MSKVKAARKAEDALNESPVKKSKKNEDVKKKSKKIEESEVCINRPATH